MRTPEVPLFATLSNSFTARPDCRRCFPYREGSHTNCSIAPCDLLLWARNPGQTFHEVELFLGMNIVGLTDADLDVNRPAGAVLNPSLENDRWYSYLAEDWGNT